MRWPVLSLQTSAPPVLGFSVLALTLSLSGCGNPAEGEETADHALIGGSEASELPPGVVALMQGCTAAKIGPRELLTAGHCVTDRQAVADFDPVTLEPGRRAVYPKGEPFCIFPTLRVPSLEDIEALQRACVVVEPVWIKAHKTYVAHANANIPSLIPDSLDLSDVAVIRINVDTPTIPIAELSPTPLDRQRPLTMGGYGCTSASSAGGDVPRVYRTGESKVGEVRPRSFFVPASSKVQACFGDSGGPAFQRAGGAPSLRIVGVNSFVSSDRRTNLGRVDDGVEARAWIRSLLASP